MEKEPFLKSQPESRPRPELIEVKTWKEFRTAVERWMCLDGDDYCPECWEKFKERLKEKGLSEDTIKKDSGSVVELLKFRKIADGHQVACSDCGKNVFRPTLKEDKEKE
jgi:DNA-directed RNA polymerase subunit RPC12/RpoP